MDDLPFPLKRYYIDEKELFRRVNLCKKHLRSEVKSIDYNHIFKTNKNYKFQKYRGFTSDLKYRGFTSDSKYRGFTSDSLTLKPKDSYFFILTEASQDNRDINEITDYFSEKVRINCQLEKEKYSPSEYWEINKFKIAKEILEFPDKVKEILEFPRRSNELTFEALNCKIYSKVKACTNYKLTFLLQILNHFKPKNWLDFSCGWSDRLIAAIIHSKTSKNFKGYVGIDPNEKLHPIYKEIIDTLNVSDKVETFNLENKSKESKFYMIQDRAENVNYKALNQTFDFIFTSPPFFTFEKYEGENTSTQMYNTIDRWLHEFLFVTIDRSWLILENRGNYLLYIEDKPQYRFIDKLLEYMKTKKGCVYNGIIYQMVRDDRYKKRPYSIHTVYSWSKIL